MWPMACGWVLCKPILVIDLGPCPRFGRSILKGSVWESDKLILNDGRWFPETADVIFFSEKFVF